MPARLAPGERPYLHPEGTGMAESREPELHHADAPERSEAFGRVVVVGGANTDVVGRSFASLVPRDSNPGFARVSSGGVGRNIAENLVRLGADVELLTALGGDHNAVALAEECRRLGIGLSRSVAAPDLPGSVYLAILNDDGEMAVAVNDVRVLERLTPTELAARADVFSAASVVVVDANLTAGAIEWIARHVEAPLLLDPVSAAKAPRAAGVLERLAVLKCNAMEGAVLARMPEPEDVAGIELLASELHVRGVAAVYITAGKSGVCFNSAEESGWLPAPHVEVANATGAGDAFSAGVVWGMLQEWPVQDCAAAGSALAAMALVSTYTVSDRVSAQGVLAAMREMQS
jgi:pseudouridine kinase